MVAREQNPASDGGGLAKGLFLSWRRIVSHAASSLRTTARHSLAASREAPAAVAGWTGGLIGSIRGSEPASVASARLGVALAALGTVLGLSAGTLGDGTRLGAGLFAAETIAWAAFRLVALAATASRGDRRSGAVFAVWGTGLLPYALGLTPGLRAVAFAASGMLTLRLLRSLWPPSSARRAVAIAFGGQALAAIASWIVLNGLVFLPLLGR